MSRHLEISELSQNDIPKNAFSSFDILNNHQNAVIQAQLTEEQANLQELHHTIEDAEQHVLYLKDLAINSAFRVFELRSPSAPWRKLPNELLSFIFLLVKNAVKKSLRTGRHPTPWIIAQVCRRWRSVACGTPSLWTDIPFFLPTGRDLYSNVTATIHLSNPLPVRICLTMDNPETKPYLYPACNFLNTIPSRIGALKLSLDRLSHFGSLSSLTSDLTALESLSIHFNTSRAPHSLLEPQHSPTAIPALQKANALRKLRFFNGRVIGALALVIDCIVTTIPPAVASRIDTLVAGHVTVSTLSTLFNHFSSLSQCAFLLSPSDDAIPTISNKVVQHLSRVKLCGSSWHGLAEFQLHHFVNLLAPRLMHLTLWRFRITSLPSCWGSHDQNCVALQYLDLRRCQVHSDLLMQMLASLPNLVNFYCTPSSNFLEALSQKISSGDPQLSLRLSVFYMDMQTTIRHNVLHICALARWLAILSTFSEMHIRYQEREDLFHLFDGPYANVREMVKHQSMDQILKACRPLPQSAESAPDSDLVNILYVYNTIRDLFLDLHPRYYRVDLNNYPISQIERMEVLLILRGYLSPPGDGESTRLVSQHWRRAVWANMHALGWCTQLAEDDISGPGHYRLHHLVYAHRKGSLFSDCVHPPCDPNTIHEGMMEDY